jgi:hypothetical protein
MSLPRTFALAVLLAAGTAGDAAAQSPVARETSLTGMVRAVSGAAMQAVSVRVFEPEGTSAIRETVTDARGHFVVSLPAGRYRVEISAPEFTTHVEQVTVPRNALNVVLQLLPVELAVDVSAADELVAGGRSLTSTTISGDALLDLPRNEEDLARYLMELAGADATGDVESDVLANFIVDGFSDGRLPRPDQIAEIIVDPSPMSADGRGGPRIEIVTRPGTGRWQRSVDLGFADESLNARTRGESRKEPRQTRDIGLEVGGPVIPSRLDVTFEFSSETDERAGNSLHAITSSGQVLQGIVQPRREREFQVGAQLAINPRHRLDVRLTGGLDEADNEGVGGFTLLERGSDNRSTQWTLQVSERMSRPNLTNNARIQIARTTARVVPLRDGFAINVADAFDGGGGTNRSNNQDVSFRVDDTLRLQRGAWNFELGGILQYGHERNVDQDNYNGTFEFASLHDYCLATGLIGASCSETARIVAAARAGGIAPTYFDARGREAALTGVPVTFTQAFGNAELEFSEVGFNTHIQADRRFGRTASLRLGLRYQGTNHSRDFLRTNPTANCQYRLTPGTLVSVGGQLSFADFTDYERLLRNDGSTYETELFISSPSFPDPLAGGTVVIGEQTRSLWRLDPDYRPPYTFNRQLSVTQEVPGEVRLTFSYDSSRGVHQRRTRNINAPYPGTPLPEEILDLGSAARQDVIDRMRPLYPYIGNVTQIESTGRSAGRTLRVRVQRERNLELFGVGLSGALNYVRRTAEDDNDFNNPYVRTWGSTRRDHEITSQFRITLPRDLTSASPLWRAITRATYGGAILNFNLRANTGRLYSILSGRDLNGDQSSRDRLPGVTRNGEVGPRSWNLNMTLTKDYALSGSRAGAGGGGRGEAAGGQGGRGGRARQPAGPRIRLQARVNNVLNRTHARGYGSVVTSPLFGLPTGYTTGRTVNVSMSLDF